MDSRRLTGLIKQKALELGFDACGISRAEFLEEEAPRLEAWLKQNHQGEMDYMARNFDKRLDPGLLVPGAKSVISVTHNYYNEIQQQDDVPKISRYAYGRDYHKVLKKKLQKLFDFIKTQAGEVEGRAFTDSAPIMEKAWAQKSGLGWVGKHTNLLSKKRGSFFFLGELIIDLPLDYDRPVTDHCGSCTKCIDACPTEAIIKPYVVDGSKCISYFTIELKNEIPASVKGKFGDWAFGCDICQEVCPWNRFSVLHNEPDFLPHNEFTGMTSKDWNELNEEAFQKIFSGTPVMRAKFKGLKRNLNFLDKNASFGAAQDRDDTDGN